MKQEARALVLRVGPQQKEPWWWKHLSHDIARCRLEYLMIPLKDGKLKSPASWNFVIAFARVAALLWRVRRTHQYIFTFECGWESFLIAVMQTMTMCYRPRHVILQFIMRERTPHFQSRLKYAFMRWCFSSVYLAVCSAKQECLYYHQELGWGCDKFRFVPLHSDPELLQMRSNEEGTYFLSVGRTFRDYDTLLTAFSRMDISLRIIASHSNINSSQVSPNVEVEYDLPGPQMLERMTRCLAVVIPLQVRSISIGQSVLLQAMTLQKPVIVTQVPGTEDYIEHMKSGIFVPPNDPDAIRNAVLLLAENPELRRSLGLAARERVNSLYLPQHYADSVAGLLC